MNEQPYAVARPDEIYVPWGRPADLGPVPGIQADAMTTARAGLTRMVERVTFEADAALGMILWEATARLRRLDEKITMGRMAISRGRLLEWQWGDARPEGWPDVPTNR